MLLAHVEADLSRTRLLAQLKEAGIAARVVAGASGEKRGPVPVLLEAEGFIARDDARLNTFAKTGAGAQPVGGFANCAKLGDAA